MLGKCNKSYFAHTVLSCRHLIHLYVLKLRVLMVVVHFVTSVLILSILSLAGKNLSWPASENAASKNKTFNCHMLVKPQGKC